MKTATKYLFVFTLIILNLRVNAQPWMRAPYLQINSLADSFKLTNFYEIQKAFRAYEKDHIAEEKNSKEDGENEGKFLKLNMQKM